MKYAVISLLLAATLAGCAKKRTYNEGCVDGIGIVLEYIGMQLNEEGAKKTCTEAEQAKDKAE